MELLNVNPGTLSALADAIRKQSGDNGSLVPAEMIEGVKHIRNHRIRTGTITLEADSSSIAVPRAGRMIHVFSPDVPKQVGYVTQLTWEKGPSENQSWQLAVYSRYTSAEPLQETQASASAFHSTAADTIEFGTGKTDRLFAAGATYVWVALDWPDSYVKACYDVSATKGVDDVKMILLTAAEGQYTALLQGHGATKNFAKDSQPWKEYTPFISEIVIGGGVTSIGERLFQRHEAVRSLTFENSGNITHLGRLAFQGCQMGGEYSFPNLEDAELAQVFSHCTKLRCLTLNRNVKSIASAALTGCLSLRKVHGLGSVHTVGMGAFINTPRLESLDIDPTVCTAFSESAFLLSGNAMRYANPAVWSETQMGSNAIPTESYTDEELAQIRAVCLPNIVPNEVNVDTQNNYPDVPYCIRYGALTSIAVDGCMAMALYHLYNWYYGGKYTSFLPWWQTEIIGKNPTITNLDINEMQAAMADALGWAEKPGFPIGVKDDPEAAKRAIAEELEAGRALVCNFGYNGSQGHSVAIIGSNAVTDKLIIADSTRTSGDKGCIYEMSFEQLFGDFDECLVIAYDTKVGDK